MTTSYIRIPPAPKDDISVVHVDQQYYALYLDSERGTRLIPESITDFAQAVVHDFKISQIEVSEEFDAWPGIFWVLGKYSAAEIKKNFSLKIKTANEQQIRWFERLVLRADDDWAMQPLHRNISAMQKLAAKALNLDRPWLFDDLKLGNVSCPACSISVPPDAALCPNCKCILNKEKAEKLAFAKG